MSELAQGQIPHGYVLFDSNEKEWIVGSLIDADGSTEVYAGGYAEKTTIEYTALLKIKPHGDANFIFEMKFFEKHCNPTRIAEWIQSQGIEHYDLSLPRYLGSAENVIIENNHFDFLVLERYGVNLETQLAKHNNLLPKPTVLKIAFHVVRVLQYLHNSDVMLGGIWASNLCLDLNNPRQVYVLPQLHDATDESDRNAVMFCSEDLHLGEAVKRGAFESLLYNMIDWSGGILPWKNALPDEAKKMKSQAFENPEQFLQDAFPTCDCEDSFECSASRKCVKSSKPVAPFKCLRAISELMDQVVSMKANNDSEPNYKIVEEILKKRLLNLYHVPTSRLEFSVPTFFDDEDKDGTYMPGFGHLIDTLAIIISENCSSFDEVEQSFRKSNNVLDIKPNGVIDVISKMKTRKLSLVEINNIRGAWEKDYEELRTNVIARWRSKGIEPGSYGTWKEEKDAAKRAEKRASTGAKRKVAERTNHESPADAEQADKRVESTAPNDTDGHPTIGRRSLRLRTEKSQQAGPAFRSTLKKCNIRPEKARDDSSCSSPTKMPKLVIPLRRTLQDATPSPSKSKSDEVQSEVSPAGSSSFSSGHCIQDDLHSQDSSSSRTPERFLDEAHRLSPKEPLDQAVQQTTVDHEQWQDEHKWLNSWLELKEPTLRSFGPISSEPQVVASQVQLLRVLRYEYNMQEPAARFRHLVEVLAKLPADSPDARKLSQIEERWRKQVAWLEERGRELGDASLDQLRDALQDVSDSLDKLLDNGPEEQLLRKMEILDEQLESQRTSLAKARAVVEQLDQVLSEPAYSGLQAKLRSLDKHYRDLRRKVDVEKAEIERRLGSGRHFDDSCKEILVWLTNELNDISSGPISTDRLTLQQQCEHYKLVCQRIRGREAEVTQLLEKGVDLLTKSQNLENRTIQQRFLDLMQSQWSRLLKESHGIQQKLQVCVEHGDNYYEAHKMFSRWLSETEDKLKSSKPDSLNDVEEKLKDLSVFGNMVREKSVEFEQSIHLGETFVGLCDEDENDVVRNELNFIKDRWAKLNNDLLQRTQSLQDIGRSFAGFDESFRDLERKIQLCEDELALHDTSGEAVEDPKLSDSIKKLRGETMSLKGPLDVLHQKAMDLVLKCREQRIDVVHILDEINRVGARFSSLKAKFVNNFKEFCEPKSERDVKVERNEEPKAILTEVIINLVSSDESDIEQDCSIGAGATQQRVETLGQQRGESEQRDQGHKNDEASTNDQPSSIVDELEQQFEEKSSEKKKDASSGSDDSEDAKFRNYKKTGRSKKKSKKRRSTILFSEDSDSDDNKEKLKGRNSEKKDSDLD